jgi:HAD superfamily hydrolase (TIGR01509 family)
MRGAPLRGVLFDLDGTLVDSNDAHARAWVEAFAEHGYAAPLARVRKLIGKGGDKVVAELAGLAPDSAPAQAIQQRRQEIFLARYAPCLQPCRGARPLLERVRAEGLKIVIASSAKAEELHVLLERAGVLDLIEEHATSDDAERSKPDPDIILAALRQANLAAVEALMIGDTPYDLEAAMRSCVPFIGVRCGGWDDAALGQAIAIYDDPMDILDHYETSPLAGRVPRGAASALTGTHGGIA